MPITSLLAAAAIFAAAPAPAPKAPAMAQDLPTSTAPLPNASVQPKLYHVWADAAGESHIERLTIAANAGALPLAELSALSYNPTNVTWHLVPQPQFAINLSGDLEVEVSDGTKTRIGPGDLVYIEDSHGKGHVTRLLGPVTCVFIRPKPGFDVVGWSKGPKAP